MPMQVPGFRPLSKGQLKRARDKCDEKREKRKMTPNEEKERQRNEEKERQRKEEQRNREEKEEKERQRREQIQRLCKEEKEKKKEKKGRLAEQFAAVVQARLGWRVPQSQ